MLVSAAAAQRRQFFSALIQRAAKMKRSLGGGTLTLLLALPGVPAVGNRIVAPTHRMLAPHTEAVAAYKHISVELKTKLAVALALQAAAAPALGMQAMESMCAVP
jgi:hypothetical protein